MNLRSFSHNLRTFSSSERNADPLCHLNENWSKAQEFSFYRQIKYKHILPDHFYSFDEYSNFFPCITKDHFKEEFDPATASWIKHKRWLCTSGSTGSSLRIPVSRYDLRQRYIRANKLRESVGVDTCLPIIQLWGNSSPYRHYKFTAYRVKRKLYDFLAGVYRFEAYNISAYLLSQIVHTAFTLKTYTIYAYTSFAIELATFIRDSGLSIPTPQSITVSSETTYISQIELLRDVFNCNVFIEYGLVEFGPVAIKPYGKPYFFDHENLHVELVQNNIIITNLADTFFPIFRYQTNDITSSEALESVSQIAGRSSDLILIPTSSVDYIKVHSEIISHCLKEFPCCLSFQCITDSNKVLRKLLVKLAFRSSSTQEFAEELKCSLASYMKSTDQLLFSVDLDTEFLRTAAGKVPAIIMVA